MRPVEANPIANWTTEQFIYRNTERFCLDVDQRVFDGGYGLLVDAVWDLACQAVQ